jgi:2-oxoglutarate dehydrogenase E1 component
MSPKSLLRHKRATSPVDELMTGGFKEILDDAAAPKKPDRLLLCSGKLYYDLVERREQEQIDDVAIVRIEQFYPFNESLFQSVVEPYSGAAHVVWVQEETKNRGGWCYMMPILQEKLPAREIRYVGRQPSASPATGSPRIHREQQAELVNEALTG